MDAKEFKQMNNCHNCKILETSYRCDNVGTIDDLEEECIHHVPKEKEAVEVKKTCDTCKNNLNGLTCAGNGGEGCATICIYDYKEHGLEKYNKWEQGAEKVDLKSKFEELNALKRCIYKLDPCGSCGNHKSNKCNNCAIMYAVYYEPEEQVEFWQAFLHYYRKSLSKAKSAVTGIIYGPENGLNLATPDEVKGKWILL
jgi:hypothetical protein